MEPNITPPQQNIPQQPVINNTPPPVIPQKKLYILLGVVVVILVIIFAVAGSYVYLQKSINTSKAGDISPVNDSDLIAPVDTTVSSVATTSQVINQLLNDTKNWLEFVGNSFTFKYPPTSKLEVTVKNQDGIYFNLDGHSMYVIYHDLDWFKKNEPKLYAEYLKMSSNFESYNGMTSENDPTLPQGDDSTLKYVLTKTKFSQSIALDYIHCSGGDVCGKSVFLGLRGGPNGFMAEVGIDEQFLEQDQSGKIHAKRDPLQGQQFDKILSTFSFGF